MNTRNYLTLLLVLLAGLTSCHKFLEEKSQSDLTPQTTDAYSQLLFGTGYPLASETFQQYLHYMDDDVQVYSGANSTPDMQSLGLPAYSWQPDFFQRLTANGFDQSGQYIDSYKNYYKNIVGCNIAIRYADGSIGSQADRDYLKGEALALRAYYYFMLVNIYGSPFNDSTTTPDKSLAVPLILSPDLAETMPSRNTVADVYRQINSDLDSAIARLAPEKRNRTIYRMNHISAHLLASRIGLFTENWDNVISNASYVLKYQSKLLSLNDVLNGGWYPGIVPPVIFVGDGSVETIWTYGSFVEYNPQNVTNQVYSVSVDLANQFESNDLRSQVYFQATPPVLLPYYCPLYGSTKYDNTNNNMPTGSAFRTSEAYLNRAEAWAQKYRLTGDPAAAQNAVTDLNTLRASRFAPSTFQPLGAMSPDSLLKFCRNERRRELFFEGGLRWFDLRRYGMPSITHYYTQAAGTSVKYVLQAHDPQYVMPIPPTAILLNNNLKQNPTGPTRMPSN